MAAEFTDRLPDGCAFKRDIGGAWAWTTAEQLQVAHEYQLRTANWQRSSDGSKGHNRPKPIDVPTGRYTAERETDAVYSRVARHEARKAARLARQEKPNQPQP